MEYKIEKMVRMRRNILSGVLVGTIITFIWFLLPSFRFIDYRFRKIDTTFKGAMSLWFLTLLFFGVRYWLYKKKLKKEPSLYAAVNDERAKLNWFKAYRFAFYVMIIMSMAWKAVDISFSYKILSGHLPLPDLPWLIIFGALISIVGSFLYYNREAQIE